jgi:formylglycine-generating enzyme required for sulfatase activity
VVTTCVNTMQVFYSGSVTDSCTTDYQVVYNPPSGTLFPLGTTPVSVTVTDALGNFAACGFVVTVLPCTVNGVKYVQWPNTNAGDDIWDGNKWPTVSDGSWFLADDFICTNTGYITDLHLWGSWQDDVNYNPNTTFWLGLFTDEPTNASNAFSHPGNLIWEQCFTPGNYSVSLWATNPGNFLDPGSSNSVRGTDSQIWYYSFYPTNPPVQNGTPLAPKTYWLGVFAEVGFEGFSVEFGWHTTTNVQHDISVHAPWAFGYCPDSLPQTGANWTPTYDNSGKPVDLAFAVGTDTNCSCSFLTITLDPIGNGTNKVIVTWPSGYLQVATNVNGPYSFVPGITTPYATSPYTNQALPPIGCTNLFWRVSCTNTPNNSGLGITTCDGMALVPGGMFTMGDTVDGDTTAVPLNVTVSAFYMDTNLVSYGQWQEVYNWATSQGYGFDNAGSGKAGNANQPVQFVDWCDAVKWCNARSQQAGLTPVYYTDTNLTQVYTSGQVTNPYVQWAANGYRLPTEAEWEKAARGGLSGQRFPWGMTVSWSQANYYGDPGSYSYDLAPAGGYDPQFATGGSPYTSPVGSFAPNGYGLYDMAGDLQEMCWDWLGTPYGQPTTVNPTGPATGSTRVLRGGCWYTVASTLTCAVRYETEPTVADTIWGFRTVRADIPFNCGH